MPSSFDKWLAKLMIAMMIALITVSCGRRGGLEAAPNASILSAEQEQQETSGSSKPETPFILDPLL